MLLDAKSVAYTAPELGGTSGVHLMQLLKKFGIYDDVDQQGRSTPTAASTSRRRWRDGEAEIGITLISEIVPVKGARMAGPLPEALQLWTVYASAIPASSKEPAARARLRRGADLAGDGGSAGQPAASQPPK